MPAAYALPSYTPDYFCHTDYRPAGCGALHGRVNYWGGSAITPSPQQEFRLPPRFLFHPNPACNRVKIKIDGASQGTACLQRHTSLYGAYAINGYRPLPTTDEEAQESETISSAALLVTAQRDKPYIIERRDLCSVSHNSIIAIAPAFRTSLSRIYADGFLHLFTSCGIYLLGAPEDSAYTALGFLCAYNVAKRQRVTTLPASVAFSSPAGIYEMSTGMPKPFGKGLRKLFDNEKEMKEFLENATLHYHPTADLLIAESSGKIMACLEETWHKAKLAGAASKSLAVATPITTDTATFTTRPLKLGDPEELKRVAALHIRGNLDAERCRLQLSASNDLRTWTLLGSGTTPLGGWAGEGWRFFRAEATMKIGDAPSALVFYLE